MRLKNVARLVSSDTSGRILDQDCYSRIVQLCMSYLNVMVLFLFRVVFFLVANSIPIGSMSQLPSVESARRWIDRMAMFLYSNLLAKSMFLHVNEPISADNTTCCCVIVIVGYKSLCLLPKPCLRYLQVPEAVGYQNII